MGEYGQSAIGLGNKQIFDVRSHNTHGCHRHRRVFSDPRHLQGFIWTFGNREYCYGFRCWAAHAKESAVNLAIEAVIEN
jgi:hypothetical protein